MLRKEATKSQKIFAGIYLVIQLISTAVYLLYTFKHKFGYKGTTRKIGDFNVTLNSDSFEGENGIFAETRSYGNNTKDITVKTDLFFRLMSENVQNCILAHECGHHLYSKPSLLTSYGLSMVKNTRDLTEEHNADTYSVQLYGKESTIKMLRWLFVFSLSGEVLNRIKMVKAM